MYRLFALALIAALLAGCSSTPSVSRDESYQGPAALAIAPVAEGRAVTNPGVSRWWIQKLMAEDLSRSDIFAGVIPLATSGQENEADIILESSLANLQWENPAQRSGTLELRVRTRNKLTGAVGIDAVYSGKCKDCRVAAGQPTVAGPLASLMEKLRSDLDRRYAR